VRKAIRSERRRRRKRRGEPKERLDEEELSPIIDGSCSATVANVHRQSIGGEEKGDGKKKKKGHTTGNDVKCFRYGVARECRKTAVAGRMSYTEVFTSLLFFLFFLLIRRRNGTSHTVGGRWFSGAPSIDIRDPE
jgi:hypothetical protein